MIAMKLLLALLLTLAFTASAGELADLHGRLAEPVVTEPAPEAPEGNNTVLEGPLPVYDPVPDIARIGLERSLCFAGCPAYTLIIENDGRFRYVGEANVERLGAWTGTIERGSLNQVLRYVAAIDFFAFEDTYLTPFLDNPSSFTLVEWGNRTKVIENYANSAPATVWALEKLIEQLLDVAVWDGPTKQ